MSNELTTIETLSPTEIMKLIGQSQSSGPNLAKVDINKMPQDPEGNDLPVGAWKVWYQPLNEAVYGKKMLFRPIIQVYQYLVYDEKIKDYTNKTINFTNWSDQIPDERGTFKCGKISKKEFEVAPQAVKDEQRRIKCKRHLYGLVSLDGKTGKGQKVSIEEYPCKWSTSGKSFVPLGEVLEGLAKQKKIMFNHFLSVGLKMEVNGNNVYYVPVSEVTDKQVTFNSENQKDLEHLTFFRELIAAENSEIMNKWRTATSKIPTVIEAKAVQDVEFSEADLNDELPESMKG